jgi:hypothetical protein
MENSELIYLVDIANQRIRHHHDALWKEETHFTWLVYTCLAGVIYIFTGVTLSLEGKAIVIGVLGVLGILLCIAGYSVVRKEGELMHEAIQVRNRLNKAIKYNSIDNTDIFKKAIPQSEIQVKSWDRAKTEANKKLFWELIKACLVSSFKRDSMGIRDWFQIILLSPICIFWVMIILSIIRIWWQ